jgi:hypothetical protein
VDTNISEDRAASIFSVEERGERKVDIHGGVSKSFRTGCLEQQLQMVQLPATRCSCIAIL